METVPDVVKLSDDTADNHKTDKAAVNDFLFERNFLACEEKNSEYKRKCTAGNVRQCVSLFNCRSGKCDEIGKNLSDCLKTPIRSFVEPILIAKVVGKVAPDAFVFCRPKNAGSRKNAVSPIAINE